MGTNHDRRVAEEIRDNTRAYCKARLQFVVRPTREGAFEVFHKASRRSTVAYRRRGDALLVAIRAACELCNGEFDPEEFPYEE